MKNINGKVVLVFPIITELVDYALTIDITRCKLFALDVCSLVISLKQK